MPNRISITVLFLFLLSACQVSMGHADGDKPTWQERGRELASKLRLSAKLQQDSVEAGQAVLLTLSLLNTSGEPLIVESNRNAYDDYSLVVSDERGKEVLPTALQRKRKTFSLDNSSVSLTAHNLAPGQVAECSLCVTALFDLTLPGKYIITVRRGLPLPGCQEGIASNSVSLTVTEPSAAYTVKAVK